MTPPEAESPIPAGMPKGRTVSKPICARAFKARTKIRLLAMKLAVRWRMKGSGKGVVWQKRRVRREKTKTSQESIGVLLPNSGRQVKAKRLLACLLDRAARVEIVQRSS